MWLWLAVAILSEVTATLCLRASEGLTHRRAVLVAAVDGLFLRQLAAERPLDEATIRALLASVDAGAPS